jgi:hypothetical protein
MRRRYRPTTGGTRFDPSTVLLLVAFALCIAIVLVLVFVVAPDFEALLRKEG